MKKLTMCLVVFLLGVTINANATLFTTWDNSDFQGYTGDAWSGYYIGLFDGNDSDGTLLRYYAQQYLGYELTSAMWDKVDDIPGTGENGYLTATATVFDGEDAIGGTWSVNSPYSLGFYSIKASNQWALYYVNPYQTEGIWTTMHLVNKKGDPHSISHLSGLPESSAPVPEPATLMLLGSGLLGLAGFRKKIK